jgi:hypothetical protein
MSRRWRWCFVAVMAATVLGGFMPRALLSGGSAPAASAAPTVALLAEEPPVAPSGCLDASCGKSAPTPAIPSLTVAALAAVASGVLAYAAIRLTKRLRLSAEALPRGTALILFRPPQFS